MQPDSAAETHFAQFVYRMAVNLHKVEHLETPDAVQPVCLDFQPAPTRCMEQSAAGTAPVLCLHSLR